MYDVYYHKQAPTGAAESPDTKLGVTRPNELNTGLSAKKVIGGGIVAAQLLPAVKTTVQNVVNASGDQRLKRNVARINKGIAFGITVGTLGFPVAVGVAAVGYLVEQVGDAIQETKDQQAQNYTVKTMGATINKFAVGGAYYD